MSSEKCPICLRAAFHQVDHEDLSCSLFVDYLRNTFETISKLTNSDSDTNTLTFCSSCQEFLVRLTKLNRKLKTLVLKVRQSCDARTTKVRAVNYVGQPTSRTDEEAWESDHEENLSDRQSEDGSIYSICGPQSPPLEQNESRNDTDLKEKALNDVIVAHPLLDLIPVGATALNAVQSLEESKAVSSQEDGSPTAIYEDKWLPKNLVIGTSKLVEAVDGKYKCGECGILTMPHNSLRQRKQHILRHIMDQHEHQSRSYTCKHCGIVCNNRASLSRHKTTNHQNPNGQFPCSDCGAILGSCVAAITHRYTVHPKLYRKKFICETCGKMFNRKVFLEEHVAFVHNGKKMNECQICGKKFGSRKGLTIHQNCHTEQRTYKCDTCGETFTKNYVFTQHKKLICRPQSMEANGAGPTVNVYEDTWLPNNIVLPKFSQCVRRKSETEFVYMEKFTFEGTEFGFKCGLCSVIVMFSTYKTSSPWFNIVKHLKRRHMDIGDHNSTITGSTIQRCIEVAPNRFQYGKYSIEEVDGKYKCGECGELKKQAKPHKIQYILNHIRDQHENSSMTFVCEYCGVVYNRKQSLTIHKVTKHGDPNGRFPCSECGKVFRNRVGVMGHRQRVHRKNPQNYFICEACGNKFSRKDLLENHVAYVHKGLKLHECEECGKKFGTTSGLKHHQYTHPGNRKYIYNISETQATEENPFQTGCSVGGTSGDPHDKMEEDSKADGLAEVEGTSKDVPQSHDKCQSTSRVYAGPSRNVYENKWLPKSLIIKSSQLVKRLSERDFIYKDEYPFHGTKFGFKCGLCPLVVMFSTDKTSAPWANLTRHMKGHHMGDPKVQTIRTVQQRCVEVAPNRFQYGKYSFEKVDGVFKCGECGILKKPAVQCADSHKNMRKHIMQRHEQPGRTFSCNYCGVVYNNRASLRQHEITKHENPNGQFPCSDCGKIFGSRLKATKHRNKAHKPKRFICEICGKDFRQRDAMEDHVAFVHKGERAYECEECGKKFSSKAGLKSHRNNHTGRRKYDCDICGMDLTRQQSVKRHKKTAHGVDK